MTPENELQAEIDAVRAKHEQRAKDLAEAEHAASLVQPLSRLELAAQVEALNSAVTAMRRDLDAVVKIIQTHFGREFAATVWSDK